MQEEKVAKNTTKTKKAKSKKYKRNYLYFYLFAFAFLAALASFSYLVKSYSPDIDVNIGNNDSLTLSESDMDVEIKSVDERLKWIQMEDEMPTVALRNSNHQENPLNIDFLPTMEEENIEAELRKKEQINKTVVSPPTPTIRDIQAAIPDFRTQTSISSNNVVVAKGPIPLPTRPQPIVSQAHTTISKVYLGEFASLEDAMATQQTITEKDSTIVPFIKATNGTYIVQLGSFYEKEKAEALALKVTSMGYVPKIQTVNK